jgi:hypothetical protein
MFEANPRFSRNTPITTATFENLTRPDTVLYEINMLRYAADKANERRHTRWSASGYLKPGKSSFALVQTAPVRESD